MKKLTIILLLSSFILGGCATMKDSVLLGVSSGAATGAATGALASDKDKGTAALTSAAIGAAVGGIASYFIHKGIEKRDKKIRRETLFNLDKYGASGATSRSTYAPAISFPVVEEQTVKRHKKGNKLIDEHKVWILKEGSNWVLEDE